MATQQEQIDWLIREVNALRDAGCGCEDCPEVPEIEQNVILPNLRFNWGPASPTQNPTDYVRQALVTGQNGGDALFNVYNLELDISNFSEIQDLNPILLIDRYKYRSLKDGSGRYRKAGYKHEPANSGNRLNEIPLTSEKQAINFNQENYFRYVESNFDLGSIQPFGMSKRYNSPSRDSVEGLECFIHLGFRLRLTIDGVDYETNHLGYLRMEIEKVFSNTQKIVTLKYRYA